MNPLQKAAARRKAFYFAAILALFTLSIFYRGLEAKSPDGQSSHVWLPAGRDDRTASAADSLARKTILSQSKRLELRELEEGEPEIAGEAVRLGLVGSRGFAVTILWYSAIEKQKRNDFHEFERLVKAVTTLQPHFITPWIFQSWNIAYNVSVEMHSLGDMYFYIARGIDLLAEGERRNRKSPDMRYEIATYYQAKFGTHDQVQTMRCLFQLSCMPPDERNPESLTNPADGSVNIEAFKKFCQDHPMLVRRLRGEERQDPNKSQQSTEALRTRRPEDVVQFLKDNRNVPGRYKNATELKPAEQQFPSLPPQFNDGPEEAHPRSSAADLTEAFSGYLAARAWFRYALSVAPPPERDQNNNPVPGGNAPDDFDQFKYRMPRKPVLVLFRQGAPRAQSYQAEMLQKDGWFDASGWEVDARIDESNAWFVETTGGQRRKPATPVVVGGGRAWSQEAWRKAYETWSNHGQEYGLLLRPNQMEQYRRDAGFSAGTESGPYPPEPTREQREDPAFMHRWRAQNALYFYSANRMLTNFPFFLALAQGEQQSETVAARKILWQADQYRRIGSNVQATKLYEQGLKQWRDVLARNPSFHRNDRLSKIEEDTFEYELEYLRLIASSDPQVRKKALEDYREEYQKAQSAAVAVVPFGAPGSVPSEIPQSQRDTWYARTAEKHFSPFRDNISDKDVPPGDSRIGTPWVTGSVRSLVLQRQGVEKPPEAPSAVPPGQGGPPPGEPPVKRASD
jgi:hypothetical protein